MSTPTNNLPPTNPSPNPSPDSAHKVPSHNDPTNNVSTHAVPAHAMTLHNPALAGPSIPNAADPALKAPNASFSANQSGQSDSNEQSAPAFVATPGAQGTSGTPGAPQQMTLINSRMRAQGAAAFKSAKSAIVAAIHRPRKKIKIPKWAIILICTIAGIIVVAIGSLAIINNVVYTPRKVADEYINAIADGHYSKATKMVKPTSNSKMAPFFTDDFAPAKSDRISDIHFSDERISGESAKVTYTYLLPQSSDHGRQTLTIENDKIAGIINHWTLATPMVTTNRFVVQDGIDTITINGKSVPTSRLAEASSSQLPDDAGHGFSYSVYEVQTYPNRMNVSASNVSPTIPVEVKTHYMTDARNGNRATNSYSVINIKLTDAVKDAIA